MLTLNFSKNKEQILTGNSIRLIKQIVTEALIDNMDPIIDDVVSPQPSLFVHVRPSSVASFDDVPRDFSRFQAIEVFVDFCVDGH